MRFQMLASRGSCVHKTRDTQSSLVHLRLALMEFAVLHFVQLKCVSLFLKVLFEARRLLVRPRPRLRPDHPTLTPWLHPSPPLKKPLNG